MGWPWFGPISNSSMFFTMTFAQSKCRLTTNDCPRFMIDIYSGRRFRHVTRSSQLAWKHLLMRVPPYVHSYPYLLFKVGSKTLCEYAVFKLCLSFPPSWCCHLRLVNSVILVLRRFLSLLGFGMQEPPVHCRTKGHMHCL